MRGNSDGGEYGGLGGVKDLSWHSSLRGDQFINQLIDQSLCGLVKKGVNRSVDHTVNYLVDQIVKQLLNKSYKQ